MAKIDVEKALKLRLQGMTLEDIGNVFGASPEGVRKRLMTFEKVVEDMFDLEVKTKLEGDLIKSAKFKTLVEMHDQTKIEDAKIHQLAYVVDKLNNMERLNTGQPTQIINQVDQAQITKDSSKLESIAQEILELEKSLDSSGEESYQVPEENTPKSVDDK